MIWLYGETVQPKVSTSISNDMTKIKVHQWNFSRHQRLNYHRIGNSHLPPFVYMLSISERKEEERRLKLDT